MENSGRAIKQMVLHALRSGEMISLLEKADEAFVRKTVNPLFGFIQSTDENIKWAAVISMGRAVAKIADLDMEAARIILRRLMWNLNDESGGIGWGSPEAMGEILAQHRALANEFAGILFSYAREDGNYLEYVLLQRGLLWGIGRLVQTDPAFGEREVECLLPFLGSEDATVRALCAWIMGVAGVAESRRDLKRLMNDDSRVRLFMNMALVEVQVAELAEEALKRMGELCGRSEKVGIITNKSN